MCEPFTQFNAVDERLLFTKFIIETSQSCVILGDIGLYIEIQ